MIYCRVTREISPNLGNPKSDTDLCKTLNWWSTVQQHLLCKPMTDRERPVSVYSYSTCCTSINPVFNMQIVSSVLKRIIVSDALPCDKCIFCVPHNQPFLRKIVEFKNFTHFNLC